MGTPEHEIEEDDFRGIHVIPFRRSAVFPAYVPAAQIYAFHPLGVQELAELRSEARDVALALGCSVASMIRQADSEWLVADTDLARWGEEIPPFKLGDLQRSTQLGDFALYTLNPG